MDSLGQRLIDAKFKTDFSEAAEFVSILLENNPDFHDPVIQLVTTESLILLLEDLARNCHLRRPLTLEHLQLKTTNHRTVKKLTTARAEILLKTILLTLRNLSYFLPTIRTKLKTAIMGQLTKYTRNAKTKHRHLDKEPSTQKGADPP